MLFGSTTNVLMPIFIEFHVVSTSKFPRSAPGDGGSLCSVHCCSETILSRTMLNISYDRETNVFFR